MDLGGAKRAIRSILESSHVHDTKGLMIGDLGITTRRDNVPEAKTSRQKTVCSDKVSWVRLFKNVEESIELLQVGAAGVVRTIHGHGTFLRPSRSDCSSWEGCVDIMYRLAPFAYSDLRLKETTPFDGGLRYLQGTQQQTMSMAWGPTL